MSFYKKKSLSRTQAQILGIHNSEGSNKHLSAIYSRVFIPIPLGVRCAKASRIGAPSPFKAYACSKFETVLIVRTRTTLLLTRLFLLSSRQSLQKKATAKDCKRKPFIYIFNNWGELYLCTTSITKIQMFLWRKKPSPMGFEPMRTLYNGLAGHRLNHSAKATYVGRGRNSSY